tara:strand:+ start:818 stop:1414 length:597 start_codon:yes stop_codon:yes gene_type:complete
MAFKMKGFSLHGGTDKHKEATEAARKASVKKQEVKMNYPGNPPKPPKSKIKKDRPQPTYEGTDEFRKEKDIPKSEFKKRGVKAPNKALVGKQKNIDVNNNGKIDGDDFKKLKGESPNKSNCGPTPAKKYKSPAKKYASAAQRKAIHASKEDGGKGAPSKFIAKAAGMLIGANKQRQAAKDAAEQAKQKGIESAMSRKL